MKPSMWCNGDCFSWTKQYSDTGICQTCGTEVMPFGTAAIDQTNEVTPDLDFEGTTDDWIHAKKDVFFPDVIRIG